jgi:Cu+-exporting ATPase
MSLDTAANAKGASTLTFRIAGMACSGCVERVEKAVRATAGVVSASVDLEAKRAVVTVSGIPDPKAVIAAIVAAGYKAELEPV